MTNALKIFIPATITFVIGILLTPVATHYFYKYKMWRKVPRNNNISNTDFHKMHDETAELATPRTGGMIIWVAILITIFILEIISVETNILFLKKSAIFNLAKASYN